MANDFNGNAYGHNYATGGGASGGGGFMNTGSQNTPGGGQKSNLNQTLRPVTIQQIIQATQAHNEAEFVCDGHALSQMVFVGIVRSTTKNVSNIQYIIDDGTGTIEVRAWLDASNGGDKYADIVDWKYVHVIGNLKSFQGRRYIQPGHMRPITDANEIFYHRLDAMHVHLQLLKAAGRGINTAGEGYNDNRMKLDTERYAQYDHPLDRKIMEAIDALRAAGQAEDGVPIPVLERRIQGQKPGQVRERVENLVGEGFLFTASDDEHVLPTTD